MSDRLTVVVLRNGVEVYRFETTDTQVALPSTATAFYSTLPISDQTTIHALEWGSPVAEWVCDRRPRPAWQNLSTIWCGLDSVDLQHWLRPPVRRVHRKYKPTAFRVVRRFARSARRRTNYRFKRRVRHEVKQEV